MKVWRIGSLTLTKFRDIRIRYVLSTLLLLSVMSFSGCDFVRRFATKTPGQGGVEEAAKITAPPPGPASAQVAPPPPTSPCADGKEPQRISGDCPGQWQIRRRDKQLTCEFRWGPPIVCPEGTTAVGVAKVCYGTTLKPMTKQQETTAVGKCTEYFGKYPISPRYDLVCCPG